MSDVVEFGLVRASEHQVEIGGQVECRDLVEGPEPETAVGGRERRVCARVQVAARVRQPHVVPRVRQHERQAFVLEVVHPREACEQERERFTHVRETKVTMNPNIILHYIRTVLVYSIRVNK